MIEAKVYCEKI